MSKRFVISLVLSIVLNGLTWLGLYILLPQPDSTNTYGIILHYNIYFGIDLIGEWYKVFYIPASGLIILIVNTLLALGVRRREEFLAAALEISTLVIQIIILIAAGLIIISNIS